MEYYYIPFPEEELINLGLSEYKIREVLVTLKQDLNTMFSDFITAYQARINKSTSYTIEEKTALVSGVTYTSNLPNYGDIVIGN